MNTTSKDGSLTCIIDVIKCPGNAVMIEEFIKQIDFVQHFKLLNPENNYHLLNDRINSPKQENDVTYVHPGQLRSTNPFLIKEKTRTLRNTIQTHAFSFLSDSCHGYCFCYQIRKCSPTFLCLDVAIFGKLSTYPKHLHRSTKVF